jgi:choline-glycine betaine transporter
MNAKQKDRLITITVVALVAGMMAAMAAVLLMYQSGSIDEIGMLMASAGLSSAMFLIVMIYAVYVYSIQSKAEKYKKFEEELRKREQQRSCRLILHCPMAIRAIPRGWAHRTVTGYKG